MRLGEIRHGPFAPEACQFGKYDIFTRMGVPGVSTSKAIRSSPNSKPDTVATDATGRVGTSAAAVRSTRFHPGGPPAAR